MASSDYLPARISQNEKVELSPDQQFTFDTVMEPTRQEGLIFVTGKAGTGKSTVLRRIVDSQALKLVVLAPTGLAALNVGGQTIHSFFGFKLGPLADDPDLMHTWKPGAPKHRLVDRLDAIVIDEISMVRADLLDAIDFSLRMNLKSREPFAGKALISFGDLWQLEPVVRGGDEQEMLSNRYSSPFFFDSKVARETGIDVLELQTVHRQKNDEEFMFALNRIRKGATEDLEFINTRVGARLEASHVLTLTATNSRANSINMTYLAQLTGSVRIFEASLTGEFGREFPTEPMLTLKQGAQVMFVKNGRQWVNGTLGTVLGFEEDKVVVGTQDGLTVTVEKEAWEKNKYTWDRSTERVTAEPVGTFTQFPLRLAWAVTIHKAQGLTFDHLRIDMDRPAFAHGQTYVALSRCRTLAGMSLVKPITEADIRVAPQIWEFERRAGLA